MERSSVFDMIGPIMIGPSSSHTAGVVRIGRVGVKLLGGVPDTAEITFYNSFAQTYEGHGSDRAIVAGLLDFDTDDERIKQSFDHAQGKLTYKFRSIGNASTKHPNTIQLKLSRGDKKIELEGESRGGGVIRISHVNGFNSGFTANLHTLIVTTDDAQGSIAFISDVISHDDCNIATMTVSRKGKNDIACQIIEMDSGIHEITLQYIKNIKWVHEVIYIPVIG
ncbi:L-serine dehydratase, iron-sulfur-dependent subunit beta [Reichenbachiella sp. 5M10]|uniref:L-serine ammonia-lyase, iron-sulfur-dependent subunit beta n=1 Tax=Reichenbachiella sp. 5M10 TaxID=1889772 RepID=UPI000C154E01|nr:L-serine ammonia-lyase, iron-sulfur-dependent subunit beta [Reichenbachiella sp. 5M10]PIB34841.1 L-serine dehydratase, iron-sulfur-dependent subunit beta [Reichenbachiella sp. 5M10]